MEPPAQTAGDTALAIAIALVLIFANAFFVAAEFALVRVRPARLVEKARQGGRRATTALFLVSHINESLSVGQVGITLCSLGLGFIGEPAFAGLFQQLFKGILAPFSSWVGPLSLSFSVGASFLLVTFLLVILGEMVPKQVAINLSERVLLGIALPLRFFWFLSWPLVALLNVSARAILRWTGLSTLKASETHSLEEIRQILILSAETGQIGALEFLLLENLIHFKKKRARDVMVPRPQVAVLDFRQTAQHLLEIVRQEGYSRYPLVEGDLDGVIGIIHVKELLAHLAEGKPTEELRLLARTPEIIPETMRLDRLLRRLQSTHVPLALVADEYGALVGIVTLEDILEELVGELRDEFDDDETDSIRARPGGGFFLDPALPFDRLAALVPVPPPPPEGVHTLAGLIQAELGRLPRAGDRVAFGPDHLLVASAVRGTRLLRVELIPRNQGFSDERH